MILSKAQRFEHLGITFYVGPRTPCPGIGWSIPDYDLIGRQCESHGAFYDGCDDHPEGAYAWAEASCRAFIEEAL